MLKQNHSGDVNLVTIKDSLITSPEEQPLKIVKDEIVDFNGCDYKSQIWPIEAQRAREQEMALQYDELCQLLQQKLNKQNNVGRDHNSRAEAIKDRMRRKLEDKKNNQAKK